MVVCSKYNLTPPSHKFLRLLTGRSLSIYVLEFAISLSLTISFFQLKAKFEDMRIAQNEEKKKIEAMRKQLVSFLGIIVMGKATRVHLDVV